ncbi:MAG: peptidoglycan DD-metalloendopeptidase family protein [Bacteroidales bacterium]|nr:peptidoglycan DD-metalloendopeptidase family protein [Bacteroidales bacterium]
MHFKTLTTTLTILICSSAMAQTLAIDTEKADRLSEADSSFVGPKSSFILNEAPSADTLDTSDPRIKILLRSDKTWDYIKSGDFFTNDDYFKSNWNERTDAYDLDFSLLPDKITLWLVDSTSHFCCPYQTKVYSKFGYRHKRRHQGCDLPYPVGTPVKATFDGKVRINKWVGGYGNLIVIRHANGLETFYGHLSKSLVEEGEWVRAGQTIALGGSTGRSTGPHLHFETRYQGYAFDPEWLIDFEHGVLRNGVFTLKKRYLSASSRYVPESIDEEEEVILGDEADKAAEQKRIAEQNAKQYYTVKKGDTLGKIAQRHGTTVSKLCSLNGIKSSSVLQIGKKLRVR